MVAHQDKNINNPQPLCPSSSQSGDSEKLRKKNYNKCDRLQRNTHRTQ